MDEMTKRVPLKLADGTVVGSALVIPDGRGVRVEAADIDDPALIEALSADPGDFSFLPARPDRGRARIVAATALYRCQSCGDVVRTEAGKGDHALVCSCDALPLGSERRHPFDPPPFGPQRPYYADREHYMVEMVDDGRTGVDDLRDFIAIG